MNHFVLEAIDLKLISLLFSYFKEPILFTRGIMKTGQRTRISPI